MSINEHEELAIQEARTTTHVTHRPTVSALEDVLYTPIPVLDHGFVRVVDYMGDDAAVVQAARVSYGKGTTKTRDDRGLIRYLARHRHTTPFEMCEIKFHMKMPIFVARQMIRTRTASVNEYSARYSILDKEFYLPALDQVAVQSASNRQGRGELFPLEQAQGVLDLLKQDAVSCYEHYLELLNQDESGQPKKEGQLGLARELARMNLTLNYYTQWYWKINLHNLMHFLALRSDPHAQYEIRVYAQAMLSIMEKWVPLSYEAFIDYRKEAALFSRQEVVAIKRLIQQEPVNLSELGLSIREQNEFWQKIQG